MPFQTGSSGLDADDGESRRADGLAGDALNAWA